MTAEFIKSVSAKQCQISLVLLLPSGFDDDGKAQAGLGG